METASHRNDFQPTEHITVATKCISAYNQSLENHALISPSLQDDESSQQETTEDDEEPKVLQPVVLQEESREALRSSTVKYLTYNRNLLPMFGHPGQL